MICYLFAGHIRNIYFPFDMETDTALSVASEMVAELDITEQDVTKIADMIDSEIISLVPEWKRGLLGPEERLNNGYCHNCASNNSLANYLSPHNPGAKNLQVLQCSKHGCTAVHGRFEEITYQFEGSEQCLTEGAPVVSSQSDGIHYSDIWARQDGPDASSQDEESTVDESTNGKEERVIIMDNCHPSVAQDLAEDYENEIRQEMRWLKAKYQMQLRELRDQQLGVVPKGSNAYWDRNGTKKDRFLSIKTRVEEESDEEQMKSFASGKHFGSWSPVEPERKCGDQRVQNCEGAYGSCSPVNMVTAKSFYTGALLPQSLHRATSLPVDAVDF